MDLKDCFLQFPDVAPVDNAKNCPKYTNIVNRHKDDGVSIDELDFLQIELEQLLAAASQRMRQLNSEIGTLSDLQENKKDKKVSRGKDTDHKRARIVEDRPVKKMKTSDSTPHGIHVIKPLSHLNSSTSSPSGAGRSKVKGSHSRPVDSDMIDEQPILQRATEVPNKFWQMVDSYCGPIPQETITLLEKMEKPLSDDYFEVPALGKHFSQVWAEEDMLMEEKEGNRICKNGNNNETSTHNVLKKTSGILDDVEPCPYGSLTQRLISAFVQENIIAPLDSGPTNDGKTFEALTNNDQNIVSKNGKASSSPHTTKLEGRIKAELFDQGLIDISSESDKEEDEVLIELRRCQQELRVISDRNRTIVSQLLKLSKDDMKKQELRKNIEIVNADVTEHYRKVFAARQKKRNLMKKEKESALKTLKEREILVKQLEQLN